MSANTYIKLTLSLFNGTIIYQIDTLKDGIVISGNGNSYSMLAFTKATIKIINLKRSIANEIYGYINKYNTDGQPITPVFIKLEITRFNPYNINDPENFPTLNSLPEYQSLFNGQIFDQQESNVGDIETVWECNQIFLPPNNDEFIIRKNTNLLTLLKQLETALQSPLSINLPLPYPNVDTFNGAGTAQNVAFQLKNYLLLKNPPVYLLGLPFRIICTNDNLNLGILNVGKRYGLRNHSVIDQKGYHVSTLITNYNYKVQIGYTINDVSEFYNNESIKNDRKFIIVNIGWEVNSFNGDAFWNIDGLKTFAGL